MPARPPPICSPEEAQRTAWEMIQMHRRQDRSLAAARLAAWIRGREAEIEAQRAGMARMMLDAARCVGEGARQSTGGPPAAD